MDIWRNTERHDGIVRRFWRDSAEQFRHIRHHSAINPPPFRHTLKKPRSWRNYDGIGGDSEEISSLYDGFLLNNSAINPPHSAKRSKNRGVAVMAELPGGATLSNFTGIQGSSQE